MEEQVLYISSMVLGVTSVVGKAGLPDRWKPLFAILFGVGTAFIMLGFTGMAWAIGIVSALAAMGLWSGTSTTTKKG